MKISFHFDFISPYAYLAFMRIHPLAEAHGLAVDLVPVLFAALLDHHGQLGPAEIPPKRRATYRKVVRRGAMRGVDVIPPTTHPFNPLLALRIASLDADPSVRRRVVERLFAAAWGGKGRDITDPREVAAMLDEIGLAGADLCRRAGEAEAKARLREQTEAAIAAGHFGVPTTVYGGEAFWGDDGLDELELVLSGRDPFANGKGPDIDDLPVGVRRPRASRPRP